MSSLARSAFSPSRRASLIAGFALLLAPLAGCATAQRAMTIPDNAPAWVKDCRTHDKARGALICAVGYSQFADSVSRRSESEANARARITRAYDNDIKTLGMQFAAYVALKRGGKIDETVSRDITQIFEKVHPAEDSRTESWVDSESSTEFTIAWLTFEAFTEEINGMKFIDPMARSAFNDHFLDFLATVKH